MAVGGEDYYYSDSDDDDVDRYVFLARQPGQHAEEDASDDDETEEDEGGGGDGRRGRKRPLIPDASNAASPPPSKKARLGLIIALPSAEQTPSSCGTDRTASSSPCGGMRDRKSSGGSEENRHDEAHERPDSKKGKCNKNKTKKQPLVGVCGKRSRSGPGCEEEVDQELRRDVITAAAKTSTSSAVTSAGRFQCNLCERCFDSHQALGGHVLGHQKKARIAAIAAAASLDDAGVRGDRTAEIAVLELEQQDANDGVGYAEQKISVAAIGANGNGTCHEKKAFDDVDTGGHRKAKKKKKPFVVAEDHHMGAHGDGNIDMRMSDFEASHEGDNDHHHNREKASSRSFHNGSEETAIGAGRSHNDADVKNKKAAALLSSRKGAANGNGNNADACRTQYKCKVCGTECPTGRALGGHMRKHRKQPAQGADGDGTPAAGGDSRMPQDCIELWCLQG